MPQRINKVSDIGTSMKFSSVYDTDNIYLSQEGWVYRHYKSEDLSRWWDEIIVGGEVPELDPNGDSNDYRLVTNPRDDDNNIFPLGVELAPTFETGDTHFDHKYSPTEKSDGSDVVDKFVVPDTSDNVPFPPAGDAPDTTPPADDSSDDSDDDSDDGSASAPMG